MRTFHSAELLAAPPEPIRYLIEGLLMLGGGGDTAGMPGSCKSTILLSMASAISSGNSWFGLKTALTPTAWISGEASSEKAVQRDIHRLKIGEADITFVLPDDVLFRWCDNRWMTTNEGRAIIDRLRMLGIGFVVIDTIGSVCAGLKEIDNDQQRQLARHLRGEFHGITYHTISHTNQASATAALEWRLHYLARAGGNGFPGAMRWAGGAALLSGEADAKAVGLDEVQLGAHKLIAFGASKFNEQPPPGWTNKTPALFELRRDGQLVLFRDGREMHSVLSQVADFSKKRKEAKNNDNDF